MAGQKISAMAEVGALVAANAFEVIEGGFSRKCPMDRIGFAIQTANGAIPASATALDSVVIASFSSVRWVLQLIKGATRYSVTIDANIGGGVSPVWAESGHALAPDSGGTFDFTLSVDISAGNMRLLVTPATTGWSAKLKKVALT